MRRTALGTPGLELLRSAFNATARRAYVLRRAATLAVAQQMAGLVRSAGALATLVAGRDRTALGAAVANVVGARRGLERLEVRQLMSSSPGVTFANGILTVNGNSTVGTSIYVQLSNHGGTCTGYAPGAASLSVATSSVKGVVINAGTGADTVFVGPDVLAPTTITGGGGNDTIRDGGGANVVNLGNGNAYVKGQGTSEKITAGDGNVTLLGGTGNDTLIAGNGNDYLNGGAGNDLMVAGNGSDYFDAGDGNDTVSVGNGNDTVYGQAGNDRITTGTGTDGVYPGSGSNTVLAGSSRTTVTNTNNGTTTVTGGTTSTPTPLPTPSPTPTPTPTPTATPAANATLTPTWVTYSAPAAVSGGPRAVIQVLNPSSMVGSGVVVRALNSTVGAGEIIDGNYQWTFGDPNGAHNALAGFNASHVYANAGTYTVTLTVTNENGKSSTATARVTIAADTRTKIYVNSSGGNDANNGLTTGSAVRTAARAAQLLGNGVELLFARGQTFGMTAGIGLGYSNVLLGAYGSGANPVLNYTNLQKNCAILSTMSSAAVAVTVQDLTLESMGGNVPVLSLVNAPFAIDVGGYDVSVLRCTFRDVAYGVQAVGYVTGLTMFDSASPDATGLEGYFLWATGGSDYSVVGNTVASSGDQHDVRTEGAVEIELQDNTMNNNDGKGVFELHAGAYMWVDGNHVSGGNLRVGPRGQDTEPATTNTSWVVIQNNYVTGTEIRAVYGSEHIMVRDNIVTNSDGDYCYQVEGPDAWGRQSADVSFLNNTGYETATGGQFLNVLGYVNGLTVKNNLYVAPNMTVGSQGTAPVYVSAGSLAGWTAVSNNVWQSPAATSKWALGGVNFVNTNYVQQGEMTPNAWNALSVVSTDLFTSTSFNATNYAPATSSAAAHYGTVLGNVYGDYYGKDRPTSGSWSAGAVQV